MIKILLNIFLFLFLIFSLVLPASGHGLGQALTKEVNGYVVELEYEALEITDDEPIEYGLRLILKETGEPVEFDLVTLRILDKAMDRGVFSTTLSGRDAVGLGPRAYLKLEEGEYTFRLAFFNGEEEIVSESFDISVLEGESKDFDVKTAVIGFLAGAVVAGAGTFFLTKRK